MIVAASFALAAVAGCAGDLENPNQYGSSGAPSSNGGAATGSGGNTGAVSGGTTGASNGGTTATGSGGMTANIPADPACVTALMNAQCISCHVPGNIFYTDLDLQAPNIGQRLANKKTSQATCTGLIIDATTPANSILLNKVKGMPNGCGSVMPLTSTNGLMGADLQCITDWINSF